MCASQHSRSSDCNCARKSGRRTKSACMRR
jgi:hypothetical protein